MKLNIETHNSEFKYTTGYDLLVNNDRYLFMEIYWINIIKIFER